MIDEHAFALCDQVCALDASHLGEFARVVDDDELQTIDAALARVSHLLQDHGAVVDAAAQPPPPAIPAGAKNDASESDHR